MNRKLVASVAMAAAITCSPVRADTTSEFTMPTYAGVYQPQGVDEQGLWSEDDESERALQHSPLVIRDAALNAYVHGVLCRTVGADRCGNIRLYILRLPEFNANMSVNGTMRVYSGLLLRVRSEAELASILGHEFAHFELRHGLASFRANRRAGDMLAWMTVLSALSVRLGGYSTYHNDRITIIGNLYAFNRDQERAADLLGFAYLAQASYRPSSAADVWRMAMNEADASARALGHRSTRYSSLAFFSTHPTSLERADTLALLANRVRGGEIEGQDAYRAAIQPWIASFLDDELKKNNFGGSEYLLERLAAGNWTADLYFARGELYRMHGNPRDLVDAQQFYTQALESDPDHTEALRGLGLSQLRAGVIDAGRNNIRRYLSARPDAPDAAMLRSLLPPSE